MKALNNRFLSFLFTHCLKLVEGGLSELTCFEYDRVVGNQEGNSID
jgi:hypothetical protein